MYNLLERFPTSQGAQFILKQQAVVTANEASEASTVAVTP